MLILISATFITTFLLSTNIMLLFNVQVKYWTTFNEPGFNCVVGYQRIYAPLINQSGIGEYLCAHHTLLAHAKTYKMYNEKFREKQQGLLILHVA